MAETIAVLSLKGGTGKTTTVRTLADVFRRIGLDVLAIDLDPQGNLSDYFDVAPDATPTIADVLGGRAKAKSARKGYLDGRALAEVFAWLRPGDLVWNYWVNNYLLGKRPPAFDILFWNSDTTRMTAALHADFVDLAM